MEVLCVIYAPLVFSRVHHALGDGYALVQLFLDFMTDKDGKSRKFVRKESVLMRLVNGEYNKHFIHTFTSMINKIFVYLYALVVMAEQLFTPPDRNSLHNRIYLSGKKICRWTQVDLIKIKEIRRSLKCRFTDVVLTVLSNSLEGCFGNWGEKIDQVLGFLCSATQTSSTSALRLIPRWSPGLNRRTKFWKGFPSQSNNCTARLSRYANAERAI
ncbi:unnamed protein product [Nesidiocoris tenuis]|uniref:O-acyltransferase WSD1 C-terminal domain-containing protein n=1 Tax=Nesidiocoris tenuis TaxID=355587 RepID=A0A6H5FZF1_9HEMI|nr:unnamed protein product [Nesidiocoris tenuis]